VVVDLERLVEYAVLDLDFVVDVELLVGHGCFRANVAREREKVVNE
jgi:hypothetical protein